MKVLRLLLFVDNKKISSSERIDYGFFLFQAGVDVQIQGGLYIGVAEQKADRLVVASGFDAAGGESVPERVEAHAGQAQRVQQPGEVVAVAAVAAGLNAP